MPNLVQDSSTSQKQLPKRNTIEVPPPDIDIPETVTSGTVEHERTPLPTLPLDDKDTSDTEFDERLLTLLDQILAEKAPPPVHASTAAPLENVPVFQEPKKVVDYREREESVKSRTEEQNSRLEKTRGGLKTRINIRRCTVETETKAEQDKQNSRRQMRSFVKPAPVGPVATTDDEIETVSRKQSLRSQQQSKESSSQGQVKEIASTSVRRETSPHELRDESLPQPQEKELSSQEKEEEKESLPQEQGIESIELQAKDNSPQQEKEAPLEEEKEEGEGNESTPEDLAKDNPTVKLKIKMSDIKQSKSNHENEEKGEKKVKSKSSVEKKRITRASVVDAPVSESTPSGDTNTENMVSVKTSLRSRQRVSYVEALEEQFATFDSSSSDDESSYKKAHNKKKKQPKSAKSSVSSTKETQVSENIFDCNVVISNVEVDQIQMKQTEMKQNEMKQNLKFNKKKRSSSCENKDVLISKKSLRSLKSSPRSDKRDEKNREKSQSLSNLDQVTTAGTQSNPSSSFNNEFIDFLKNTVSRPEPADGKPIVEIVDPIEPIPSIEEQVPEEVINTEKASTVDIVETSPEPCTIPPVQEHLIETVGTGVQTDVTDIPTCLEETTTIVNEGELCPTVVSESPVTSTATNEDKPPQEETNNNSELNVPLVDDAQNNTSTTPPVDNIETTITDVIKASCIEHVASETDDLNTMQTTTVQNTPFMMKQTRKRTQYERTSVEEEDHYEYEEENNCKKMKCSYDEQPSPIPFTELMIPEVVLTEDLPVSVNIGTMCDPIPTETRRSIPVPPVIEMKPISKVIKHVDTCEKSVSTDVTKIQFSIYPEPTPILPNTISPSGAITTTVNKDVYNFFDGFGKHLSLYGSTSASKKPNYYDNEGNNKSSQHQKISKTAAPLFNSSTSSIRSVIQTKSVSSLSITPSHRPPPVTVINYPNPSDDMPMDLSRKHIEKPIMYNSRAVIKPQETCIRRSTSTTPDCIAYKIAATRDSTTPESGCKIGSSSTTPDSVYSSHDTIVPRPKNTNLNTNTTQGRGKLYELPRQSPQTMQMMHTRLWDMQDLPYHSMLINDNSNYQEHLPPAQLMNAPNLIPIQTLSPEYTAQRNLFIANQMYVSALQAFQDAASTSTSQKSSYAVPSRKRGDGMEAGRRKKVRDVMTNVPVLSYEQLQQSNIGLERRLEENVFQYQSSSTATSQSTSTSVIQRTEVSSDQSTLTYIHNSPDEECLRPNMLENYSTLQSYGLNSNIVSQIQNLSSNRLSKPKGKGPRR